MLAHPSSRGATVIRPSIRPSKTKLHAKARKRRRHTVLETLENRTLLTAYGDIAKFAAVEGTATGTIVLATFTDTVVGDTAATVSAFLPPNGWGDGTPA